MKTLQELIEAAKKAIAEGKLDEAKALTEQAKALKALEDLAPTDDAEMKGLKAKIAELEAFKAQVEAEPPVNDPGHATRTAAASKGGAAAQSKTGLGDTEAKAFAWYLKTGDGGGLAKAAGSMKASNDTDMNIATPADGGYAVPTGHYQGIIARRDEMMLATGLGVRRIPGKGTTVNVPVDAEDDGEFVQTGESSLYDRDAPALDQKPMTLVKYTKRIQLTNELLEDEDSNLMTFLNDFVGRGLAKTHNGLLLTEVAANGTAFKTFASATAIAAGEPEDIIGNDALDNYLDDSLSTAWVMRNSTLWTLRKILAEARLYANSNELGELLGYPVKKSAKAGAIATTAKSVFFGNWNYVGFREAPGMTVLRDPYSRAGYGEVILHYYFRADYQVLQAEAIGYGVHP